MIALKTLTTFCFGLLVVFTVQAQNDKSKRLSPPAQVTKSVGGTTITIDYSKPSKTNPKNGKDRIVFGKLVPYGAVWRTGANENTWIEVSDDVKVNGKVLAAGKYGLHTIPGEKEWVIIFNKENDKWGSYEYKESEDILRVKAKATKTAMTEVFDISIEENGNVNLVWEETKVTFQIK